MADIKIAYGASAALTVTLASLASSATAARESTAIDNGTNLYRDAIVGGKLKLQTGTPANDKSIYIYVYGSEDGTDYTDNATGTDAAVTLRDPTNLRLGAIVACPDAGGLTYKIHPFSVAAAFGGLLPRKWGVVVRNYTAVTLSATAGDHEITYSGVYETSA